MPHLHRFVAIAVLLGWGAPATAATATATPFGDLVREALAAEARRETRRALELFLAAASERPGDPIVLQKIARQYSDLVVDLPTAGEKKAAVERALDYSRRAVALAPGKAENVLSVAICLGKLGLFSGPRDRVRHSHLLLEEASRALAHDPNYAWTHHVLGRWHYEAAGLGPATRWFVKVIYGGLPNATLDDSVRHLQRAVELEPGQLKHHLELGFAYVAAGEPAKARVAFATGLAMAPREKHDESTKARARAALALLDGA